jgi:hypothetical protein
MAMRSLGSTTVLGTGRMGALTPSTLPCASNALNIVLEMLWPPIEFAANRYHDASNSSSIILHNSLRK